MGGSPPKKKQKFPNGLIIAVGSSVKLLEKMFLRQAKKKLVLSKNSLRIAVGR
jgi:hypothetical protein